MIVTQKINTFKVKPIKLPQDTRPVRGGFLFPKPYCTTYLLGKKNSGKTNALFNIMCNRIETNTTLVIFSATLFVDDNWIAIKKFFEKKKVPMMLHTSVYENGVNKLQELVDQLEDEARAAEEEKKHKSEKKKKKAHKAIKTEDDIDSDEEKEKKPKTIAADWLIVIDDLSSEIKDKSLEILVKKHRHFKSMILISNQTLNDLAVATRKNLDYWILFKDIDEKKLLEIYNKCSLGVSFAFFQNIYLDATKENYNFFYFSCNSADYRHNFDRQYKLPKKDEIKSDV